ncbi:MAG TPA: lytic transglycosylase domain-containing protein [Microvirga sp.]|jgi:hypothetical protein|nr:lytic transglycosylase domain-containing protein [Microvirga sp.]
MRARVAAILFLGAGGLGLAQDAPAPGGTETVQQALCRIIESSAAKNRLPPEFLTRLIWAESSFRASVTSPAGAQGIAQFMPGTAQEWGLADPFDPEQAIPKAAEFLRHLRDRFGNLGLAAAAYNGGPARVAAWMEGRGGLPDETRTYVVRITGRPAEDWAAADPPQENAEPSGALRGCLQVVAALRIPSRGEPEPEAAVFAPWGVQLAGNFSKALALSSFARARRSYASIIGDVRPMVIGTRLRSRGTRAFYRIRVPAPTREAAGALCDRLRRAGGGCVVLPS